MHNIDEITYRVFLSDIVFFFSRTFRICDLSVASSTGLLLFRKWPTKRSDCTTLREYSSDCTRNYLPRRGWSPSYMQRDGLQWTGEKTQFSNEHSLPHISLSINQTCYWMFFLGLTKTCYETVFCFNLHKFFFNFYIMHKIKDVLIEAIGAKWGR